MYVYLRADTTEWQFQSFLYIAVFFIAKIAAVDILAVVVRTQRSNFLAKAAA